MEDAPPPSGGRVAIERARGGERAVAIERDERAQRAVQAPCPLEALGGRFHRRDLALANGGRERRERPRAHDASSSSGSPSSARMKRAGSSASARSPAARSITDARCASTASWAVSSLMVRRSPLVNG